MSTSLTSLIIGQINTEEEKTSIQVNCNPVSVDLDATDAFTSVTIEVTVPSNAGNVMPLTGGAIIKVDPGNSNYTFLKENTDSFNGRVARVNGIVDKNLKSWASSNDNTSFSNYKNLADLRIELNKTFYNIAGEIGSSSENFYSKDGVPEFIFSTVNSSSSADSIDKLYQENQQKKTRDDNLSPFLALQYIPFESILYIYSLLSTEKTIEVDSSTTSFTGVGSFVGNLGMKFSKIYAKLKDLNDKPTSFSATQQDNIISAAILELFPIYRIGEEVIIAEADDKLQLGGYYTFFNSKFYLKTPDLSGLDSTEYYSNFTSSEVDGVKNYLFFALEVLIRSENNYGHFARILRYNQLPSLTLKDGIMSYPDSSGIQEDSQIFYTGLDSIYLKDQKNGLNTFLSGKPLVYLSPLIKSSLTNNNLIKSTGPGDKSLAGITINSSQTIEIATIPLSTTPSVFAGVENEYDDLLTYGTVPLYKSTASIGVTSLDTFLSAINRPEIAIADRENNSTIDNRETLFYSTEQQYTRYITSGNLPKFLFKKELDSNGDIDFSKNFTVIDFSKTSFPNHWIEMEYFLSSDDEKDVILQPTTDGKTNLTKLFTTTGSESGVENLKIFDISNPDNQISFATYLVDPITGQFVRLPSPNISIILGEAVITSITPNGYLGGPVIKTNDTISLEIAGKNLSGAKSLWLVQGTSDKLIADDSNSTFITTNESVQISSTKKWSEITSSLGEFFLYLKVENTKNKTTNKDVPIYISADTVESQNLPKKDAEKINFYSLNSIYYTPNGKPDGLEDTEINTSGPDSIPALFDGNSIKIRLGSNNDIFTEQNRNNLFTYLCFTGNSAEDLVKTFGLQEDVISITVADKTYYTNKNIVWYFGDQNFSKSFIGNSANLSFPGPIENGPFNIRALVEGSLKPQNAYFIFSNSLFTSNQEITISQDSKTYPVSILQVGSSDIEKPAFINPPYILGAIAKSDQERDGICNFDLSEVIRSSKQSKDDISFKIKKAIPSRMFSENNLKSIKNGEISIKDKLKYLFILFYAPKRDKKYYKDSYSFYVGSKEITGKLVGKIKYLGSNVACAFFKDISSINLNGYSDISISINSVEYSGEYTSDLYTKVSKKIAAGDYEISESENTKTVRLLSSSARRISTYTNLKQNDTSLILPINSSLQKYQKFGYIASTNAANNWQNSTAIYGAVSGVTSENEAYLKFASPIRIEPVNLEIAFGNIDVAESGGKVVGAVLSDLKKNNGEIEEDIIFVLSNGLRTLVSKDQAESYLKESNTKKTNISARNDSVLSSSTSSSAEISIANESNSTLSLVDGASASLSSILADANATAEQITAAVDALNSLMKQASALSDQLSSANFSLSGLVDAATGTTTGTLDRPTEISSLNESYCYLPESFDYDENYVIESTGSGGGEKELFVTVQTRIKQNHTLKARVPEIFKITVVSTGKQYEKENFGDIILGSTSTELRIEVLGGDRDLKFELSGYRASSTFEKQSGEYFIYNVILEPSILTIAFAGSDCINLTATNSNRDRLKAERVLDPTAGQDIDKFFDKAKGAIDKASKEKLDAIISKAKLKVGPVIYDKALAAKEFLKSICDLSFHLTVEVSAQLKFLKLLYIPIKVIFCIIDVICALLNPVKLAFAIIRLFTCLFDLILLLPQISMPVLFLSIALHILELLLCVIQKALGLVVAINETIDALDLAVRNRDFESIKNLEITLNEHFLTVEADLQVIEPILQILGLILELLQLAFAFPCQVTQDEDEPACIDPSMLAGLIVGKVAPKGKVVPDAMIPIAQDYTNLSVSRVGDNGNTPDTTADEENIVDIDYNSPPEDPAGSPLSNVLYKVVEAVDDSTDTIVSNNSTYSGSILPDLVDSQTNENKTVLSGGFFSGDQNGDGFIDNVNYGKMRFSGGEFDASFSISCTKSKKRFSFGTATLDQKNDPRFVEFQFNSAGLTSSYAWSWAIGWLFRKKIIDDLFTLDSPPAMLKSDGQSLGIFKASSFDPDSLNLISPIDGFSDFLEYAGIDSNGNYSYRAKPLVADIEVYQSDVDPVTGEPIVTSSTVTKTFGGIPCFAIVDEKFNVYFVEENGLAIRLETSTTGESIPVIDNIFAKMINSPSAETQKFDREERQLLRSTAAYEQKDDIFKSDMTDALVEYCNPDVWNQGYENNLGDAIVKMQANAGFIEGLKYDDLLIIKDIRPDWVEIKGVGETGGSKPFTLVDDGAGGYITYINYRNLNDVLFLAGKDPNDALDGSSEDFVGVNGMQRFIDYLLANNTSGSEFSFIDPTDPYKNLPYSDVGVYDFANGNWAENDDFQFAINTIDVYNFPQIYFVDLRQVADDIAAACSSSQTTSLLLDMPGFNLDFGADVVEPYQGCLEGFKNYFFGSNGVISKAREDLLAGKVPARISTKDIKTLYENLVACTNTAIDDSCKFVINPLNTTFKLLEDNDETDLENYVDPSVVITEVITDGAASTMPTITGAMEYASGIGDSVIVRAGDSATIQIIPRDSYDDEIIDSFDARSKISVSIVSDTTADGARIEKIDSEQELLWAKNGSIYTAQITANTPGKVTIKASICDVVIQAVTDRGIPASVVASGDSSDCIPDATATTSSTEIFAPGALIKVDRILTILFTANQVVDSSGDSGAGTPSIAPQAPFTDMVN